MSHQRDFPLVAGVILFLGFLPYALFPRRMRDWEVRWKQRESYVWALRVVGIIACTGAILAVIYGR